ncbi:DNA-binding protein [Variovorax sp. OK605]|uniref:DNA-binding protein n=1 Tax=Variovorax sp. OK605 TaxID=1855317 RepID=UPI000B81F2BB|nr:DNA-binding protein [Variovorax sp. OK605]
MDSPNIDSVELEQVRKDFFDRGLEVTVWARAHGFHAASVYRVLNGQSRARRGASHHIAVALGLKSPPPEPASNASPSPTRKEESR